MGGCRQRSSSGRSRSACPACGVPALATGELASDLHRPPRPPAATRYRRVGAHGSVCTETRVPFWDTPDVLPLVPTMRRGDTCACYLLALVPHGGPATAADAAAPPPRRPAAGAAAAGGRRGEDPPPPHPHPRPRVAAQSAGLRPRNRECDACALPDSLLRCQYLVRAWYSCRSLSVIADSSRRVYFETAISDSILKLILYVPHRAETIAPLPLSLSPHINVNYIDQHNITRNHSLLTT